MRVKPGANNLAFASWLAELSYNPTLYGMITLPQYFQGYTNISDLIQFVYPQAILSTVHNDFTAFTKRCILAFHNKTVNHCNSTILQKLPGNIQTFHAIDTSDVNEEDPNIVQHPAEYLQSLDCGGLPPSRLQLKVGSPDMLLHNLYPSEGLCNGTRMIVA